MLWPLYLHESAWIIHRIGVKVDPRASLDAVKKKNIVVDNLAHPAHNDRAIPVYILLQLNPLFVNSSTMESLPMSPNGTE